MDMAKEHTKVEIPNEALQRCFEPFFFGWNSVAD